MSRQGSGRYQDGNQGNRHRPYSRRGSQNSFSNYQVLDGILRPYTYGDRDAEYQLMQFHYHIRKNLFNRAKIDDFMNARFSDPEQSRDRRDYLVVMQQLSDFFGTLVTPNNENAIIRYNSSEEKVFWREVRKYFLQTFHQLHIFHTFFASYNTRPTFEDMHSVFESCEERYGGILLIPSRTHYILSPKVLTVMQKGTNTWTYPKGKVLNFHDINCGCGYDAAHYDRSRRRYDYNDPILRERAKDCAMREVKEETGLGVLERRTIEELGFQLYPPRLTIEPYLNTITFFLWVHWGGDDTTMPELSPWKLGQDGIYRAYWDNTEIVDVQWQYFDHLVNAPLYLKSRYVSEMQRIVAQFIDEVDLRRPITQ